LLVTDIGFYGEHLDFFPLALSADFVTQKIY
jgi:hypothetical protein